ncbi:hypothetical protein OM076_33070 [Solirubrobacter ginsenosidimutans]|uniref:Uncharacterized protein n=1 Tax=Solirubrobacter ginsenosidimutans TaxID=490573 RepID=A0A9X3S9L7_9ACTN|nr:hypothetical protein [Solirubrobacter ginsenosidimutans]MDA0165148.1 hypothetical protein [Solirubrobacter ginsenosidimutans]
MSTTATRTRIPLAGGHLATAIAGGLILFLSATAAVSGAALQWTTSKQDAAGYYTTTTERLVTTTSAIATDDLDVNGVPGSLGRVRITAQSRNSKPIFTGIARTRDVDAYLRNTAHKTLTDFDVDPFDPTYRTSRGTETPARPADQSFWAATSDGAKPLEWKVRDGNWSVVVMNADGSAGVDAGVSAGAKLPILGDLELAAWIAAALFLALGGGLLAAGLRRGTMPAA